MNYRETIADTKNKLIDFLVDCVINYGFNDATYNDTDNYIPLSDGGVKYDGYYINGFIPYGCIVSDRRVIVSIYIYKTKIGNYNVGFCCGDFEDDLIAQDLYLEQLASLVDFVVELIKNKEDYEKCHDWHKQGNEE